MKKNAIIFLGFGAIAIYMLMNSNRQNQVQNWAPQFQRTLPPPPAQVNSAQWAQWAQIVLNTYGNIAALWQPGGPFYKGPSQEELAKILGGGVTGAGF